VGVLSFQAVAAKSAVELGARATLAELEEDPHPLLARLRAHEPVSWLPVLDGWLVTRHDLALAVMRDAAAFTVDDPRFSTARVLGESMLSLDGEEHARHRAPFVGPFRVGAVRERFAVPVAAEVGELIDGMIANAVLALLQDPARLAAVRRDPALLDGALEESLRLEPAAAVIDRYAVTDAEIGGASVRRGDLVRVSISAANRDPAVFADPDRFVLGRPDARRHLAFAQGPHVCVGVHLARLEARTALAELLERLPGLRLDPEGPCAVGGLPAVRGLDAVRGLVFRKPPRLDVVWG
jgi:cytochrome P450